MGLFGYTVASIGDDCSHLSEPTICMFASLLQNHVYRSFHLGQCALRCIECYFTVVKLQYFILCQFLAADVQIKVPSFDYISQNECTTKHCVSHPWQDGEHQCEDNVPKYTEAQLKLMKSQDIRYVNFKRSLELKVHCMCQFLQCVNGKV